MTEQERHTSLVAQHLSATPRTRHLRVEGGPAWWQTRVIDIESGEMLDNVVRISFEWDALDHNAIARATITVLDPEISSGLAETRVEEISVPDYHVMQDMATFQRRIDDMEHRIRAMEGSVTPFAVRVDEHIPDET